MQKIELNIGNIISILEKNFHQYHNLPLPYGMTTHVYNDIIEKLLNTFFNYKSVDLDIDTEIYKYHYNQGTVYIKHENIYIENGFKIEFNSLYPNLIIKLWESGEINFNIYEFGILYSFLVKNYTKVKKLDVNENIKVLWRKIINYTYGILININYSPIKCDYIFLVTSYMFNFYNDLRVKYNDLLLYIDTDVMYLDYITNDLLYDIKNINIPFEIESYLNFYLIDKKKILVIRGDVDALGRINKYKSNYELEKNRLKKIKKLKNDFKYIY